MGDGAILKAIEREMQTGVLVLGRDGVVRYCNPFFSAHFSPSGAEVLQGKKIDEVLCGEELLKAVRGFLKKSPGLGQRRETEINENDRFFKMRAVPLEGKENPGVMIFLQDITDEKRVEAVKKDFVANVSHELRTPLASIKGYAETLLSGGTDDKKALREFLKIIDKHATRMSLLIDDLLTLSRLESHQSSLLLERVDINELVRSAIEGLKKQAKDKGITLEMDLRKGLPDAVGDRKSLEQVMVNLLDNAIKYTQQGGRVGVSVSGRSREIRVDVRDTGIGIPKADIPRIFERFYRVDKARSREVGGTGLGLAIVKHIIQGLNGRVWVQSEQGKGSTFSFTLKAARRK